MKLVHWPSMGGLLHLVQRGGDWAGRLITFHTSQCTLYSIAMRMRTGPLCACALCTRVDYNLLQFISALWRSSAELPASSNGKALACWLLGACFDPTVGSYFFKFCSVSVGFLYNFSIAICHLFSLTSTSVNICVFWSHNLLFPWPKMLTSVLCSLRCMKSKIAGGAAARPGPSSLYQM